MPRLGLQPGSWGTNDDEAAECKTPAFRCLRVQFAWGLRVSRDDLGGPDVGQHFFFNKTLEVQGRRPKAMDWKPPFREGRGYQTDGGWEKILGMSTLTGDQYLEYANPANQPEG